MIRSLLACSCALAVLVAGCAEEPAQSETLTIPAEAYRYTVRGVVVRLPSSVASRDVQIHHEPIPDWKNAKGEVIGMNEMVMPFPLAGTVALDTIAVGDTVEAEIAVWYNGNAGRWVTTRLTELPPGTELKLEDRPGG